MSLRTRPSPPRAAACLLALSLPAAAPAAEVEAPGRRTPIDEVVFVAFDTETTGFSHEKDRIVELGLVRFQAGKILESRTWLVNPGRNIPHWAERVHHINDDMVADQPGFEEVYPAFLAALEGAVLLAHNARFDLAFVRAEAVRCGRSPPPNQVLDTLALFRTWFPEAESHSLAGLARHLGREEKDLHRAVGDCRLIVDFFREGTTRHPDTHTLGRLRKDAGGTKRF